MFYNEVKTPVSVTHVSQPYKLVNTGQWKGTAFQGFPIERHNVKTHNNVPQAPASEIFKSLHEKLFRNDLSYCLLPDSEHICSWHVHFTPGNKIMC